MSGTTIHHPVGIPFDVLPNTTLVFEDKHPNAGGQSTPEQVDTAVLEFPSGALAFDRDTQTLTCREFESRSGLHTSLERSSKFGPEPVVIRCAEKSFKARQQNGRLIVDLMTNAGQVELSMVAESNGPINVKKIDGSSTTTYIPFRMCLP